MKKTVFLFPLMLMFLFAIPCSARTTSSQDFIRIPIVRICHRHKNGSERWKNIFSKELLLTSDGDMLEFEIQSIDNDDISKYATDELVFNKYNPVVEGIYEDGYTVKTDYSGTRLYNSWLVDKNGNYIVPQDSINGWSNIRRIGNGVYKQTNITGAGLGFSTRVFTTGGDVLYSGHSSLVSTFVNGSAIMGDELVIDKREVPIIHNNKIIKTDEPAYIIDGRTAVPLRVLAEELEFIVDWDENQQKIHIKKDDKFIEFKLGNNIAVVNGKKVTMQIGPYIRNGRTFVLLRDTTEMLGFSVEWNSKYNMAFIK